MAIKKITIIRYADPGHSWYKVPHKLLEQLGITNLITHYSYKRGDFAYLEEDCDATTLIQALNANRITYRFKSFHSNKQSKIRSYTSFTQMNLFS